MDCRIMSGNDERAPPRPRIIARSESDEAIQRTFEKNAWHGASHLCPPYPLPATRSASVSKQECVIARSESDEAIQRTFEKNAWARRFAPLPTLPATRYALRFG